MEELKYTYAEPKDKPISSISVPDGYGAAGKLEVRLEKIHTSIVPGAMDSPGWVLTYPRNLTEIIVVIQDGSDSVALKVANVRLLIKALEDIAARGVPK